MKERAQIYSISKSGKTDRSRCDSRDDFCESLVKKQNGVERKTEGRGEVFEFFGLVRDTEKETKMPNSLEK